MAKLEDLMLEKNMARCAKCGGRLLYKYSGIYECEGCHAEAYDDFGRVKKYIEDHGPAPANEISKNTGVGLSTINQFLRAGRVEIPEGSGYYINCAICGAPIRYGKYCMECAVKSAGEHKGVLMEEAGERVKNVTNKMHYLGNEENEDDRRKNFARSLQEKQQRRALNIDESSHHSSGRKLDLRQTEGSIRRSERTLDSK